MAASVDNYVLWLHTAYAQYGLSKAALKGMLSLTMGFGYAPRAAYDLVRAGLSEKYGVCEIYSIRDIESMTGESLQSEIMERHKNLFKVLGLL